MMRFLLFMCLLLRAAVASSDEIEASGDDGENDDEDQELGAAMPSARSVVNTGPSMLDPGKATGLEDGEQNEFITIVIVASVGVVVLSIVAIGVVVLVRWRMHNRQQQGIYSVPAEQGQKGAV